MPNLRTEWKRLMSELRLLRAEKLLWRAWAACPKDHPDSAAMAKAMDVYLRHFGYRPNRTASDARTDAPQHPNQSVPVARKK